MLVRFWLTLSTCQGGKQSDSVSKPCAEAPQTDGLRRLWVKKPNQTGMPSYNRLYYAERFERTA